MISLSTIRLLLPSKMGTSTLLTALRDIPQCLVSEKDSEPSKGGESLKRTATELSTPPKPSDSKGEGEYIIIARCLPSGLPLRVDKLKRIRLR